MNNTSEYFCRTWFFILTALNFMIVQTPSAPLMAQNETPATPENGRIAGFVRESASGEVLSGIRLVLTMQSAPEQKQKRIQTTNKLGWFAFSSLAPGRYTLSVSGAGYTAQTTTIEVRRDSSPVISIKLKPHQYKTETITVESAPLEISPRIGVVTLTTKTIKQLPALGGEHDVFRALQLMPGVKTSSEISSGLNVRGGSSDQNLILLDGVPVYNPYHLGGFLSIFNTDAIGDVQFFKGAFPAEYGGRLSSVLDLTMREGSKEKVGGSGYVSMINAKALLEGPIIDNATFLVSARRMYLDGLMDLADSKGSAPRYNFYDANAKINYTFSEHDRLFLSFYGSADRLYPPDVAGSSINDRYAMNWSNITANLRWMHIVSPELLTYWSLMTTAYTFSFNAGLTGSLAAGSAGFQTTTSIQDIILRGEAQWIPDATHSVKAGVEITRRSLRSILDNQAVSAFDLGTISPIQTFEATGYLHDDYSLSSSLLLSLGARLTYFGGTKTLYAEPRASLTYKPSENLSIYAGYGLMRQFSHLVSQITTMAPTDTWFPASERLQPEFSTQYVVGAQLPVWENNLTLSVEAYYKTMAHLYEFREDAQFLVGAPAESQLTGGTGKSYGLELLLQKTSGALTGWLGYTFSYTDRQFPELNNGKPFFPRFDKRHDLTLALTYRLNDRWEFGASWTYQTGQPVTLPTSSYNFVLIPPTFSDSPPYYPGTWGGGYLFFDYTERNAWRMPAYHRLDLSATHHFFWFELPFYVSLNVYNAYNRSNPHFWWLDGAFSRSFIKQLSLFPVLPTIGIGFKF